ncbi:hypothetical protein VNI00_003518 [Paramarasmius palmivorus]|uniref:DUF6533 domain-containing protein n=1 Tax=Paramarasmius palmivorus TaxID=297713 RepID=A0AAW0DS25_9AGAR
MTTPGPDALLQQLKALFTVLEQTRQVNYMLSIVFLGYDIIIMLDAEVEFIWSATWSFPKALYLFARYYGVAYLILDFSVKQQLNLPLEVSFVQYSFPGQPSNPFGSCTCRRYLKFYALGGAIMFTTAVNVILVMRLHALYGKKKKVLLWLLFLLIGEFASELYISAEVTTHTQKTTMAAPPGIPLGGCLATAPQVLTLVGWVPCLIAATIFFGMTLYQMVVSLSNKNVGFRWSNFRNSFTPLLSSFYVDGAIYFSLIASILLISTITSIVLEGPLIEIAIPWLVAIYSFSGSRLVLNLRRAAMGEKSTMTWEETMSFRAEAGSNSTSGSDEFPMRSFPVRVRRQDVYKA